VGGGGVGHTRWDAGDAVRAYSAGEGPLLFRLSAWGTPRYAARLSGRSRSLFCR
jgi:hypothetical protein